MTRIIGATLRRILPARRCMLKRMLRRTLAALVAPVAVAGCASTLVRFSNATPGAPLEMPGELAPPEGAGPFAAVILLHGCHGVSGSTRDWARWFRDRRHVALGNGPGLERARRRGVTLPEPGFQASVAVYPGGCCSLIHEVVVRPLLVLMGDVDDSTTPDTCVAMVEAMRRRGADFFGYHLRAR